MAEKKLSEELRHCLEDDACGDCQYNKPETKPVCKGLLQKAYEVVKRYEGIYEIMRPLAERLNEYVSLEEQGKLLKLPCAVGDTLYSVRFRKIYCEKIENEYVTNRGLLCALCEKESDCQSKTEYFIEEIKATLPIIANLINGSDDFTIYLTRQEAEDKLEKMREGD